MNDKKDDNIFDSEPSKILTSIYLSPKVIEELDEILFLVKKQLPIEQRRRLTKSAFFETALRLVVENVKSDGIEGSYVNEKIQKLMQS